MLLAELIGDDVKNSLYAKTKDYYVGDVGKVAYKGYLIIETSSGEFIVEKEGHRICTKNSLADAKKDIDYLTQDSKSEEVGTSDSCKVGDVAFGGFTIGEYNHKNLGKVKIDEQCLQLQKRNPDSSSIYVNHNGEIKEVSKKMISGDLKSMDGLSKETIIGYKKDGEKKFVTITNKELFSYSNVSASEAAKKYLADKIPGANIISVSSAKSTDSCKVGDVAFGGKGYKCTKCHATADAVHKIVHVKDGLVFDPNKYDEGQQAKKDGWEKDDNPYIGLNESHAKAWDLGFQHPYTDYHRLGVF